MHILVPRRLSTMDFGGLSGRVCVENEDLRPADLRSFRTQAHPAPAPFHLFSPNHLFKGVCVSEKLESNNICWAYFWIFPRISRSFSRPVFCTIAKFLQHNDKNFSFPNTMVCVTCRSSWCVFFWVSIFNFQLLICQKIVYFRIYTIGLQIIIFFYVPYIVFCGDLYRYLNVMSVNGKHISGNQKSHIRKSTFL